MPFYAVLLHGRKIGIQIQDSDDLCTGFFTTRWVRAGSVDEAQDAACEIVLADWTEGKYAQANVGRAPILSIEEIAEVSAVQYLWRHRRAGHTFYSAE